MNKKQKKLKEVLTTLLSKLSFDVKISQEAIDFINEVESNGGNINLWQSYKVLHLFLNHFHPLHETYTLTPEAELYLCYHALKKLKKVNEELPVVEVFVERNKKRTQMTIKRREDGIKRKKWNLENPDCKVSKWDNDTFNVSLIKIIDLKDKMSEIARYYHIKNMDKYLDFEIPIQTEANYYQAEHDIKKLFKQVRASFNSVTRTVRHKYPTKCDKFNELINENYEEQKN